ncbi:MULTISPECIES: hypothetical protein [unclassified Streptomyces]|uniref:hypothetical protein n=1 Tax=unclassified Streptomyces TaxID=2593676 RepID=UPI001BEA8DAC|nr:MULTISPECIES: hypothetical protein [unclassified Streptomyces]MBT2406187.1 hypothetical protein [Streptomyces sp. ISL-21]MBT2609245.1 hypothetical protein [Streptomyces sp. ISL-87]
MSALRMLDDVEASFAYMQSELGGSTQVTTHLAVEERFGEPALVRAVADWVRDLPVLALRIREAAGGGLWFHAGPPPGREALRHGVLPGGRSVREVLREELNEVLPAGGPLWRLRALEDPSGAVTHLFFTRNHAISDGFTTGVMAGTLLARLFGSAPAGLPGLPGSHGLPERPGSAPHGVPLTYQPPRYEPSGPVPQGPAVPDSAPPVPFDAAAPWAERRADFTTLDLTVPESAAVKAYCAEQRITVNEFFATALAESFGAATGRAELDFFTAVSLRGRFAQARFLSDPGCRIGVVRARLRLGGEGLAANAARYRSAFGAADAAWRPPARDHAEIRDAVRALAGGDSAPGICVTNVGVVDPALGPHADRVSEFRTVVNRIAANYAVVLHLSTFRGAFGLSLAYGAPSVDREVVLRTAELLRARALAPHRPGPPAVRGPAARGSARRTPAGAAG